MMRSRASAASFARNHAWRVGWIAVAIAIALMLWFLASIELPKGPDAASHILRTFKLGQQIATDQVSAWTALVKYPGMGPKWPPLFYAISLALQKPLPGLPGLHATTLFILALALAAFYLACRALIEDPRLRLVAMVALFANPVWVEMAVSYSLEMLLLTTVALWIGLVASNAHEKPAPMALLAGIPAGLLLLSKAVVFAYVIPIGLALLTIHLARHRTDKKMTARLLAFLLPSPIVTFGWYLPRLGQAMIELVGDIGALNAPQEGRLFYLSVFTGKYALGPLVCGAGIALFARAKPIAKSKLLLLGSGFLGPMIFFASIGTKRDHYSLGVYLVLVLLFVMLVDRANRKTLGWIVALLLVAYSGIAISQWSPAMDWQARALALGTTQPLGIDGSRGEFGRITPMEISAGTAMLQALPPETARDTEVLVTAKFSLDNRTWTWMMIREPRYALTGWRDLNPESEELPKRVESAERIIVFEMGRPGKPETWQPAPIAFPEGSAARFLRNAVTTKINSMTATRRISIERGLELAVYESIATSELSK
jgi:hypothetical protein